MRDHFNNKLENTLHNRLVTHVQIEHKFNALVNHIPIGRISSPPPYYIILFIRPAKLIKNDFQIQFFV